MTSETGRSPGSGGRPRPSLLWHESQLRALNKGPSPSRALALAGAATHGLLKNAFPIENSARAFTSRLAAGRENAWRSVEATLVAPPEFGASNRSSCAFDASFVQLAAAIAIARIIHAHARGRVVLP